VVSSIEIGPAPTYKCGHAQPRSVGDEVPADVSMTCVDRRYRRIGFERTQAAQAVQHAAYPDAYAKHTAEALRLVGHVGAALGLSTVGINPAPVSPPTVGPKPCKPRRRPGRLVLQRQLAGGTC
jgi:hypothetical protein